jgi:hypothetical protein
LDHLMMMAYVVVNGNLSVELTSVYRRIRVVFKRPGREYKFTYLFLKPGRE